MTKSKYYHRNEFLIRIRGKDLLQSDFCFIQWRWKFWGISTHTLPGEKLETQKWTIFRSLLPGAQCNMRSAAPGPNRVARLSNLIRDRKWHLQRPESFRNYKELCSPPRSKWESEEGHFLWHVEESGLCVLWAMGRLFASKSDLLKCPSGCSERIWRKGMDEMFLKKPDHF